MQAAICGTLFLNIQNTMARCPGCWLRISPVINELMSDVIRKTNESDEQFGGIQIDSEKAVRPNLPASNDTKPG